ncbi:CDP-glycerol glycerophosphotransferase family protein [Vibrio metschnikovii]|uniref:CDP-glycerol glycerophosphotransferase family protein n=1 Tax=Vibrio metschnikovii TaxID=28172 RepID=UPI002FC6FA3F
MQTDQTYRFLLYVEQNYSFAILRPFYDYAKQLGHDVKWLLVGHDASEHLLLEQEERVSLTEAVNFNPHAVLVPGDRVPSFIPGIKVQVFHGLNESKRGNVYPERGLFDLYCTEGHERTNSLKALAKKRDYFQVIETGWLKLDSLFNYKITDQSYQRPQILFASTFSPNLSCAELVYEEIKRLSRFSQWQWLVTLHPKMKQDTREKYQALEGDNLLFFDNDRVIEMLHRADVMVCDNSSIFQEFLLLNKPVVTVNNRDPQASFINITQAEQLESAIKQAMLPDESRDKAISSYGPSVTPYLDGKSSARVLYAITSLLESGWKDRKPKNWFRNFKIRNALKYWKI